MGCGLFTSNEAAVAQAFETVTKWLSFTLDMCLRPPTTSYIQPGVPTGIYDLEDLNPNDYRFKLVLVPFGLMQKLEAARPWIAGMNVSAVGVASGGRCASATPDGTTNAPAALNTTTKITRGTRIAAPLTRQNVA